MSDDIAAAWRAAANDLGIRVTAPFSLPPSAEHEGAAFIALVHEYGSPAGTLVATVAEELAPLERVSKPLGYFVSLLNPDSYGRYDRQLFMDTLNDWGYFGPDVPPGWYSGMPWTS